MPGLTYAPLKWDKWNRSKGCRHWMDKKSFAGKSFSSIFWDAMRLVFYDEHDKPGLLYQGKLYPLAQEIIALNGRRYHFSEQDEIAMLKFGNFHYLGYAVFFPALRFEGPDQDDIGKIWGEAPIGGSEVDVGFHDILDTALTGKGLGLTFPQNDVGLRMITYFTAAIVLHEMMHNHFFRHPQDVNWNRGSDYASSLPHVAALAVLRASPEWSLFTPHIGSGFPRGGYMCCGTRPSPATPITRQGGWRRCKKCEGMFYGETSRGGKCPAGGAHDKSDSGNYLVTQNTPDDSGQHYWRWCNKCQSMFYAGHGTGTCSSGGGHDPNASGDYSLAQNVGESGVENNWRWCNKCQGLFFAGHQSGVCPQGGGHDKTSSGDYSIPVAIRVSADNCPSVFEVAQPQVPR